jgi:hypothetical protein
MRYVIALLGVFIAVACLEYAVFLWRRRNDRIVAELTALEEAERAMHDANVLVCLHHVTNLLDAVYLYTSSMGVRYDRNSRRAIATNVQIAREIIAHRAGPSPFIDRSHIPGNIWPFTKDGKVKP